MPTIFVTVGLPGSGKTTWTKTMLRQHPNAFKRVNKDDLRAMLDDGQYTGKSEKFILKIRDAIINSALLEGKNIIVDDTNLNSIHIERIKELAKLFDAKVEIKSFLDVSLEECIERDRLRPNPVGAGIIRDMHKRWLVKDEVIELPVYNPDLPSAIICDIDGTLALHKHRGPFDTSLYHTDEPNQPVIDMLNHWLNSCRNGKSRNECVRLLITSGRDEAFREATINWFKEKTDLHSKIDALYMRPEGDRRNDSIIKQEIYETEIKGQYNVLGVIDDRNRVVDMWRRQGLTVFQCANGNF